MSASRSEASSQRGLDRRAGVIGRGSWRHVAVIALGFPPGIRWQAPRAAGRPPGCGSDRSLCRLPTASTPKNDPRRTARRSLTATLRPRSTGRRWVVLATRTAAAGPGPPTSPAHPAPAHRRRRAAGRADTPARRRTRPPRSVPAGRRPRQPAAGDPAGSSPALSSGSSPRRPRPRCATLVRVDPDHHCGHQRTPHPHQADRTGPQRACLIPDLRWALVPSFEPRHGKERRTGTSI